MRVVCVHIPRVTFDPGRAIYVTKREETHVKFFMHQLDELAESIWEPFSLEMYAGGRSVYLCMAGSDDIVDVLATGIYSWNPECQVMDIEDYTEKIGPNHIVMSTDLRLTHADLHSIQTYKTMKSNSLIPTLMPLQQIPETDRVVVQLILRPIKYSALSQLSIRRARFIALMREKFRLRRMFQKDLKVDVSEQLMIKSSSRLFWTTYRITAFSELSARASAQEKKAVQMRLATHLDAVANGIKSHNLPDCNSFYTTPSVSGAVAAARLKERRFLKPYRMSSIELSSCYHIPTLMEIPSTAQVLSKRAPAPPDTPSSIKDETIGNIGHTNYRDLEVEFGFKRQDRRRHLYVLGKSGTGKSCLLQLLVRDDIEKGYGCAVLDPHGDLIDDILKLIPRERIGDVVLFDPSNPDFAPSFNPMAPVRPELKLRVAMSFLDSFKRIFGSDWSEKMDHVLRYAVLGLMSVPGCNLGSLRAMLSDDRFRADVVRQARDESVKRFWLREFAARRGEFEQGPISRLLNRLDELLATDMMRQILGQSGNLFNFREFMDTRKIVLLKVSKGVLGSENASLLGSMLIWKIYEAAMSRADVPAEDREDFYFYVDEFQNFASDSFGEILSEARKYNLSLTFANQYLSQLPPSIRKTIFGNVANLLTFRVGAEDAQAVATELAPVFGDGDILNLAIRDFYVKMSINGQVQSPFSGRTLDLTYPPPGHDYAQECIAAALKRYCVPLHASSTVRAVV
jgi:hypothetical protein